MLDNTGNVVVKYIYNALGEFTLEGENIQLALLSLTGIEPIWFEMENRLPSCVKKA